MKSKIWVYTRAYNAEKTIRRAIESVLNQTYENFVYLIRDNGSSDNTYNICEEYASKDTRVKLVHNEKNNCFLKENTCDMEAANADMDITYGKALAEDDYACFLDADDEYTPDFFKRCVSLNENKTLDIIIGGSELVDSDTSKMVEERKRNDSIIVNDEDFSTLFPEYHWHMRQMWGKLFRKRVIIGQADYYRSVQEKYMSDKTDKTLYYGSDTVFCLYTFGRAKSIGILSGINHKYYINSHSVSYRFDPNRIESDWILHAETEKYLIKKCGFISNQNKSVLAIVYAYAVKDTVHVIHKSGLSSEKKLREYCKIVENNISKNIFELCIKEVIESKQELLSGTILCYDAKNNKAAEDYKTIINELAPKCASALQLSNACLIFSNPDLAKAVLADDSNEMMQGLIRKFQKNEEVKKYNIYEMIKALAANDIILKDISGKRFIKSYGYIYLVLWKKQYQKALDMMTSVLKGKNNIDETFLWIYLTVSALINKPEYYIFGKIVSAGYYLKIKQYDKCRDTLNDLDEMNVQDDEVIRIKKEIEIIGK